MNIPGAKSGRARINEWEMFKTKFGKKAYILFPLVHILGLAVVIGLVYLIIKLLK